MGRVLLFVYGVASYVLMFVTSLYSIGFVGNYLVPKSIDSREPGPIGRAIAVNALLLGIFAVQHSVMARQGFKKRWTRIIAEPIERSTYNLFTTLILVLMIWQWRPMTQEIWNVENPAGRTLLTVLFIAGWVLVYLGTFLIDHLEFFGLQQVYRHLKGSAQTPLPFKTPALYQMVRHPIMLGFIVAFWSAPRMTAGHLFFAAASTAYILVGIHFEERDLVRVHGAVYEDYRKRVPMLLPIGKKNY